ncbi:MAG: GtrA family protein [Rhodocyclaceae bacterium]|nr:GtrA family protein [Rhodocyclaceae bacterium]
MASVLARQFVAFAGMGVVGTLAHYSTLLALVEWVGLTSVAGSATGFIVGALVNYSLNYNFTFRSTASHRLALPRFMTVATVGFFLNSLFMMAGTRWTPLHYLVVQVFATGAVLFWGFAANSLWTFKRKDHDR